MSAEDDDLFPPAQFDDEQEDQKPAEEAKEAPEEPEQTPEPHVEPEESPTVPVGALKSVREENKALKTALAEMDEMKRMLHEMQRPKPDAPPNMFDDPEGYQAHIERAIAAREVNMIAEMSERFARSSHGDAAVDEAFEAARSAGVIGKFSAAAGVRDPWGELVKWHKSQKAMEEIGPDPTAYKDNLRKQILAEVQAELAAESVKAAAVRGVPSLAAQPNLAPKAGSAWTGPTSLDDILGN